MIRLDLSDRLSTSRQLPRIHDVARNNLRGFQLDDKGPVGGQRDVFLGIGIGGHSRSVPRRSRSREDGRAFHLRRRVFDLRRWTFAPRSRSVVGGQVDHRQLSLRRAEIGGVVAFGEPAHDLPE